ncbi:hypothetical protein M427DRAFT_31891 [Gonapodya prolifera JEL478]|uniref:Uncharacterized protein n=1 Tax=Gonapodya prolifera (strain JEL478) TaxID=1344416 RepID=A0A139AHQ6_GONPJ|nr:hypothetical protein M427DRAFT_31891 [Gonapodya prolifera JEL478]|eukprot:KXS15943.1 hypothetical protein M427DRAFT_31891 [Gonapodya prolifera JEL478]
MSSRVSSLASFLSSNTLALSAAAAASVALLALAASRSRTKSSSPATDSPSDSALASPPLSPQLKPHPESLAPPPLTPTPLRTQLPLDDSLSDPLSAHTPLPPLDTIPEQGDDEDVDEPPALLYVSSSATLVADHESEEGTPSHVKASPIDDDHPVARETPSASPDPSDAHLVTDASQALLATPTSESLTDEKTPALDASFSDTLFWRSDFPQVTVDLESAEPAPVPQEDTEEPATAPSSTILTTPPTPVRSAEPSRWRDISHLSRSTRDALRSSSPLPTVPSDLAPLALPARDDQLAEAVETPRSVGLEDSFKVVYPDAKESSETDDADLLAYWRSPVGVVEIVLPGDESEAKKGSKVEEPPVQNEDKEEESETTDGQEYATSTFSDSHYWRTAILDVDLDLDLDTAGQQATPAPAVAVPIPPLPSPPTESSAPAPVAAQTSQGKAWRDTSALVKAARDAVVQGREDKVQCGALVIDATMFGAAVAGNVEVEAVAEGVPELDKSFRFVPGAPSKESEFGYWGVAVGSVEIVEEEKVEAQAQNDAEAGVTAEVLEDENTTTQEEAVVLDAGDGGSAAGEYVPSDAVEVGTEVEVRTELGLEVGTEGDAEPSSSGDADGEADAPAEESPAQPVAEEDVPPGVPVAEEVRVDEHGAVVEADKAVEVEAVEPSAPTLSLIAEHLPDVTPDSSVAPAWGNILGNHSADVSDVVPEAVEVQDPSVPEEESKAAEEDLGPVGTIVDVKGPPKGAEKVEQPEVSPEPVLDAAPAKPVIQREPAPLAPPAPTSTQSSKPKKPISFEDLLAVPEFNPDAAEFVPTAIPAAAPVALAVHTALVPQATDLQDAATAQAHLSPSAPSFSPTVASFSPTAPSFTPTAVSFSPSAPSFSPSTAPFVPSAGVYATAFPQASVQAFQPAAGSSVPYAVAAGVAYGSLEVDAYGYEQAQQVVDGLESSEGVNLDAGDAYAEELAYGSVAGFAGMEDVLSAPAFTPSAALANPWSPYYPGTDLATLDAAHAFEQDPYAVAGTGYEGHVHGGRSGYGGRHGRHGHGNGQAHVGYSGSGEYGYLQQQGQGYGGNYEGGHYGGRRGRGRGYGGGYGSHGGANAHHNSNGNGASPAADGSNGTPSHSLRRAKTMPYGGAPAQQWERIDQTPGDAGARRVDRRKTDDLAGDELGNSAGEGELSGSGHFGRRGGGRGGGRGRGREEPQLATLSDFIDASLSGKLKKAKLAKPEPPAVQEKAPSEEPEKKPASPEKTNGTTAPPVAVGAVAKPVCVFGKNCLNKKTCNMVHPE